MMGGAVRTSDFGLPQIRERLYFVMLRADCGDEAEMDARSGILLCTCSS